ncbi:hypothetical protein AG1IA_09847 [Rhizoctonia solani AG-1 IA]|uniref:Uncharacterized protein n=1 Tax=Thanatephorus cucumeris (strain AG1-IA) TaxID=983506 RepID=L8WHB7_THACA|nr:hypothetical protein AG1IA_09847 [Rhizoctonia solani AG-1 IA]
MVYDWCWQIHTRGWEFMKTVDIEERWLVQTCISLHSVFSNFTPASQTDSLIRIHSQLDADMSGETAEGEESGAPKKISTSGPRGSRREEWRKSKGLPARSKRGNRMNKHGVIASSKRSGRTKRRR